MKRVVLLDTRGPRNAGLAARAVANFPPAELWLVRPRYADILEMEGFLEMAHGVKQPRERFPVVSSLREALGDCTHSVGFTARFREHRRMEEWPRALARLRSLALDQNERLGLVFGNERFGLSSAATDELAELIWIPTGEEHTSINLGMCVGIILSDLMGAGRRCSRSRKGRPLVGQTREFLKRHLQDVLGRVVLGPAARRDLEASIERVFGRAALETRDARAWHRLLRRLGGDAPPTAYGLPPPERIRRSKKC